MRYLDELERIFFSCETVDLEDYPEIGAELYQYMSAVFSVSAKDARFFVFLRFLEDGQPFLDLYLWDLRQQWEDDLPYKRFVIVKDKAFSEADEKLFCDYCHNSEAVMEISEMEAVLGYARRFFPEIHLERFDNPGQSLEALYFSMHRSGVREILYKAGLGELAYSVEKIPSANLIGSSPSSIFDGLSMDLLRKLNSPFGVELLSDVEHPKEFFSLMHGEDLDLLENLTFCQCRYLRDSYRHGLLPDPDILYYLSELLDEEEYVEYLCYLDRIQALEDYFSFPMTPSIDARYEYYFRAEKLYREIVIEGTDYDRMIKARYRAEHKRFEYPEFGSEGGDNGPKSHECEQSADELLEIVGREQPRYLIRMPKSLKEFVTEAEYQCNCLISYLKPHARGDSTILFLREADNPGMPFVSMEVDTRSGAILQAYHRFNEVLSGEEYDFISRYALEMGLKVLCAA